MKKITKFELLGLCVFILVGLALLPFFYDSVIVGGIWATVCSAFGLTPNY